MSNMELKIKVNRLVIQSGYEKSEALICPIMKIMKMRYKDVPHEQVSKVVKEVLQ